MAHDLKKKWRSKDVQLHEKADFSVMLLSDRVLSGLTKAGFKTPSPIQLEAIPIGRFGKDLLVQAKSGTGKTLVFTIVALEMLKPKLFRPQVLVLAPTREVAAQICSVIKSVGSSFHKLTCHCFIGGLPVVEDKEKALTCQIAVGTPGRVKQLITLGSMPTNSIRLLVFDEADELLQGTFKMEIDEIFKSLPKDKQVIATSATYPPKLRKIIFQFLKDPFIACLNATELALLGIVHYTKVVSSSLMPLLEYKNKLAALEQLLTKLKFCQCLVFCNMISRVEVLCKDIKKWGFSTAYISSAKEQNERLKAIDRLKHFKCKVLISSDVTSRGIDAENVDLVVNFDLALSTETYLHRVGRAGRYGSVGLAVSILTEKQLSLLKKIESEAAFKSYILPEPLPKDLIRNPSFGEYTFEIKKSTKGVDEEHEIVDNCDAEGNGQPIICDGETEGDDLVPNSNALEEDDVVELKHVLSEEIEKSPVEITSKNSCQIVNVCDAKNDNVSKENKSLTIIQKLEMIDPEKKNCISLVKNGMEATDEKNFTNMNADINNSSDKDILFKDSSYVKDFELKKMSFVKDNKPFDVIQTLKNVYPETKNSISPEEVPKVTTESNGTNINPSFYNCTEKDVMKESSFEECFETREDNVGEICNTPEMSSTDNVNKKLDDLVDHTIQSSQTNEVDGKDSVSNDEKYFGKEGKDAEHLRELNFTITNYIVNYETEFLRNEPGVCSDVPHDGSLISKNMVINLLSNRRNYIYRVFKKYEEGNCILKAPAEVQLKTTQSVLVSDFKQQADEENSVLKQVCEEMCPEPTLIPQEVCNISKDQSGKESKDCDKKLSGEPDSARTFKDPEILNKKYEKNMSESLDSSDDEFQSNYSNSKLFQSTPVVSSEFSLNELMKDIRIFGESSSESSGSDTALSPSHTFSIDSDVPCSRKFSMVKSSDSGSDSDRPCDTSSSEKGVHVRKNTKTFPKHQRQQNNLRGVSVLKNFECCDTDSNPSPARHEKLPHNNFKSGRFHQQQRRDSLNTQSEYSAHQISNNPERFQFTKNSMPMRHYCQPVPNQQFTGHHLQTTCEPRHRGTHCQRGARSSGLHCTQGAASCCASLEHNCHPQSNVAFCNAHRRHDIPCYSSTAHASPYEIFYQQWQYLQRCMNVPF